MLGAIKRGVPLIELDIDSQLGMFALDSYDVVVLSRTLQAVLRPDLVLAAMRKIALPADRHHAEFRILAPPAEAPERPHATIQGSAVQLVCDTQPAPCDPKSIWSRCSRRSI